MFKGTIEFWNETKGFGHIKPDDARLFTHITEVNGDSPFKGQRVEYEIAGSDKGECAVEVTPLPSLLRGWTHDVFISHAFEDKADFVQSLADALKAYGLNIWYDEMTLKIGDNLRSKIDKGIANSKVGLVVLSPAFMNKGWTNYELDGIIEKSVSGEQILIPIWHGVTRQQVIDFSPSLANKVARNTAIHTVDEIAKEIAGLIRG